MTSTSSSGSSSAQPTVGQPTVGQLLRDASARLRESGSETARLDAELLLGHVLRADRATLLAAPEAFVGPGLAQQFGELVDRRATGEPVAYIRGLKEFYGLALTVDRRALIPRPETELLVELGIERVREMLTGTPRPPGSPPLLVWDVGAGSGAVCVALAVESRRRGYAKEMQVLATDVDDQILALAIENAVSHGVADVIRFERADLLDTVGEGSAVQADLVLANLPYIPSDILPTLPVAASFEPAAALDGGPDGLTLVRRLLEQLPDALRPQGDCLLEIGSDQAEAVRDAVNHRLSGWYFAIHDDLSGRPRVAEVTRESRRSPT